MGDKKPRSKYTPQVSKKPTTRVEVDQQKMPKAATLVDAMELSPAWRLAKVQFEKPYNWDKMEPPVAQDVCTKLAHLESRTWKQILFGNDRHYYHQIARTKLCKEAQERLAELSLDDLELLICLRMGSTERVWGFLDHNVFNLLWWDPDHEVYPVEKKHT